MSDKTFAEIVEPMAQRLDTAKIVGVAITLSPDEAARYANAVRKLAAAADRATERADLNDRIITNTGELAKEVGKLLLVFALWVVVAVLFNS